MTICSRSRSMISRQRCSRAVACRRSPCRSDAPDLVVDMVQPQLRRLVRDLEKPLLRMRELVHRLLQLEQFRHTNVTLVVGIAASFEDGSGVGHAVDEYSVPSAQCSAGWG